MSGVLEQAAAKAVQCVGIAAGERVAVLHNPDQAAIAQALADAARALGAEVELVGFAKLARHGAEPPQEVADAILRADACLAATGTSLSHTRARLAGTARGNRFASLPTITEDIFARTVPVDYAEMTRAGDAIAALITQADSVHITSALGTDVTISVAGRDGRNDDGNLRAPGAFGNLPAGEGYVAPVEHEGEGVMVFDGSIAGHGRLTEPVRARLRGGRIVEASGAIGAWLLATLDAGGESGRSIAELGIGTNPAATLGGVVLEDEKIRGTAHIAFGSSAGIGGVVQSDVHLDAIMLAPTVEIAGTTVVADGKLVI